MVLLINALIHNLSSPMLISPRGKLYCKWRSKGRGRNKNRKRKKEKGDNNNKKQNQKKRESKKARK